MLTPEEAKAVLLEDLTPLPPVRALLRHALGRALRETVRSTRDLPISDNSAMDGFAVRAADTQSATPESPARLGIVGTVLAGDVPSVRIEEGKAARIMTGAPIPPGADAVVPIEVTRVVNGGVLLAEPVRQGAFVRPAGEDAQAGDVVMHDGDALTSARIGVLAMVGRTLIDVGRAPRVAIVNTGGEVAHPAAILRPGQLANANGPALVAAIQEAGGEPGRPVIVGDDRDELRRALTTALDEADVVVTTGGVSMGETDFIPDVMRELGMAILIERVAQKPGMPLKFGRLGHKRWLGLPGNPTSSLVCFEIYGRLLLRRMQGYAELEPPPAFGRFAEAMTKPKGKAHFVRAVAECTEDGIVLRPAGAQGSGLLTPLAAANCLAILDADRDLFTPEDAVPIRFLGTGGGRT
ncbi:MAG: molybdopterin molybdotransferase MoeA [Deltaproteobacteria bacterium]|nr:molybdopterin molybdotransferase MoeA [Deltaproteobacteria bacterium]